jgi:hypothetical protein
MAATPPSSHATERPQWSGPPSITLPPLQLAIIAPLHSGNGSSEDAIYCHRLAYPGHLHPPPNPIKGCPHSSGAPHTFTSPTSHGAEVLPLVRRLLAAAQALVSHPSVALHRPLCVATLTASRRGSERPLGRALVSHCQGPVHCPPWTGAVRGPQAVD